jgi:hypothetical protein
MTKDGWVFDCVDNHWFRVFEIIQNLPFLVFGRNIRIKVLLFLVISKPLKEPHGVHGRTNKEPSGYKGL